MSVPSYYFTKVTCYFVFLLAYAIPLHHGKPRYGDQPYTVLGDLDKDR